MRRKQCKQNQGIKDAVYMDLYIAKSKQCKQKINKKVIVYLKLYDAIAVITFLYQS